MCQEKMDSAYIIMTNQYWRKEKSVFMANQLWQLWQRHLKVQKKQKRV